jgi:hypothetical protein
MKIEDISQQRNLLSNAPEVTGSRKGDPGAQQTPSEVQQGQEAVETRVELSALKRFKKSNRCWQRGNMRLTQGKWQTRS